MALMSAMTIRSGCPLGVASKDERGLWGTLFFRRLLLLLLSGDVLSGGDLLTLLCQRYPDHGHVQERRFRRSV